MRILFNLMLVVRPHNVAAAVFSSAVGWYLAGSGPRPYILLAGIATAAAAGYTINDICDLDIDTINRPARPLPSGALSAVTVRAFYGVLLAVLIVLLLRIPRVQAAWIAAWAVLLHLYSLRFKRMYLVGNLLVSAVSASGFLLGALSGGDISRGVAPACFTFLFMLGRELVKDCEDIKGDLACGARTVPIVSGTGAACTAATVLFILLALGFPLPYVFGMYGKGYGIVILLTVVPILAVSALLTYRRRKPGLVSILLKSGMFFGILAFLFGGKRW